MDIEHWKCKLEHIKSRENNIKFMPQTRIWSTSITVSQTKEENIRNKQKKGAMYTIMK